jgi:hypothetical protein
MLRTVFQSAVVQCVSQQVKPTMFYKNSPGPKGRPARRFLCVVVRLAPESMVKMRKRRRSPVTRIVSTTATRWGRIRNFGAVTSSRTKGP